MARKITVFELHFDGARFGPTFGETRERTEPGDRPDVPGDSSSASRLRKVLPAVGALVVASVVAGLAVRRFRGDSGDDRGIAVDEVEEGGEPLAQ